MKLRAFPLMRRRVVATSLSDVEARRRVRPLTRAVTVMASQDAPAPLYTDRGVTATEDRDDRHAT